MLKIEAASGGFFFENHCRMEGDVTITELVGFLKIKE